MEMRLFRAGLERTARSVYAFLSVFLYSLYAKMGVRRGRTVLYLKKIWLPTARGKEWALRYHSKRDARAAVIYDWDGVPAAVRP